MKRQRSGSDFKRVGKLNNQGTLELGFGCHHVVAVTRLAGDNFTTPYIYAQLSNGKALDHSIDVTAAAAAAMSPTKRPSKYEVDSDDEQGPKPEKRTKTKKGTRAPLQRPLWNPANLALRAIRGQIDSATVDALFINKDMLRKWPAQFRLRLVRSLIASGLENPIYKRHSEDLNSLAESLEAKVGEEPGLEQMTAAASVLSAWLGCSKAVNPAELVSEGTMANPDLNRSGVNPSSRQVCELLAYTSAPRILSAQGDVTCFCKEPAAFKQQQPWNRSQEVVSYYVCREGRCRMHITTDALGKLNEIMNDMNVDTLPIWFCPNHPEQQIKMTLVPAKGDEAPYIKARCGFYNAEPREFCVSEALGPDGEPHRMTGEPLWKAMDLLTR